MNPKHVTSLEISKQLAEAGIEIERKVEDKINSLGNLTESYNKGTYEGLMTTKKIIKSKRTEV